MLNKNRYNLFKNLYNIWDEGYQTETKMTIKVKNSVAKYTLFAILIISSNIITAQTFAENQEDNYFISISVSQQTKAAPDQMAFRDWYELLANILLSGKTYDIYNDCLLYTSPSPRD